MNHKNKVKLARKLRTPSELKEKIPIFQTKAWDFRKEAIAKRVFRTQKKGGER